MSQERIEAALSRVNEQTNGIAADVAKLETGFADVQADLRWVKDQLSTGMSAEKVAELATRLEQSADSIEQKRTALSQAAENLTALGAETDSSGGTNEPPAEPEVIEGPVSPDSDPENRGQ